MRKLPKRSVILAVVFALMAGIAGQDAAAAPPEPQASQQQQRQQPPQPAAAEPDPELERLIAQLERDLIADIVGSDNEDTEVRAAAQDTLRKIDAGDRGAYHVFFNQKYQEAKAQAKKRKEAADAANRAQIEPCAAQVDRHFVRRSSARCKAMPGNASPSWSTDATLPQSRTAKPVRTRKNSPTVGGHLSRWPLHSVAQR